MQTIKKLPSPNVRGTVRVCARLDAAHDLVLLLVVVEDGLQAGTLAARLLLELVVDDRPAENMQVVGAVRSH